MDRLGLRLGNSKPGRSGQDGSHIVFLPGDVIDDGGFIQPPTVVVEPGGTIKFNGKKASGASGKFIYDVGPPVAGRTYTMKYDPDFTRLANNGVTAMVGFGLKSGNRFRLTGLQGNGAAGINAHEVSGSNWNQTSGFTDIDGGLAAHGTQAGPNWLQFEVSADGLTYTMRSSADGLTWTDEFTDIVPSPHTTVSGLPTFGIAVFLQAGDAGDFSVQVTLWTSGVAPTITSTNTASVAENATLSKALTASESVTWSIVGGADQAKLELSGSTARFTSNGTKDFEAPDDADTNNTYVFIVRATSVATGLTRDQTITVTVTDVAEGPTLEYLGSQSVADVAGTTTFASQNIGTATADRLIIMLVVGARGTSVPRTISSISIGGTNGTIHRQAGNSGGTTGPVLAIASRVVAAGTTMASAVVYSGTNTQSVAHYYALKNYSSATPVASNSNGVASGNPSTTVDITAGGVVLALWAGSSGASAGAAISGASTEDYDAAVVNLSETQVAAAHQAGLAVETARAISAVSAMTHEIIMAASWR